MRDTIIRDWAFFVGVLIGIALYIAGRFDQRRHDLKKIRQLRGLNKGANRG